MHPTRLQREPFWKSHGQSENIGEYLASTAPQGEDDGELSAVWMAGQTRWVATDKVYCEIGQEKSV